jgi:hypothetical protein
LPTIPPRKLEVRLSAMLERIAKPSAPPICWEVLKIPEASPASDSSTLVEDDHELAEADDDEGRPGIEVIWGLCELIGVCGSRFFGDDGRKGT